MAEELDDGEFWLPPRFLTEDDVLLDIGNAKRGYTKKCLPGGNDGGFQVLHGINSFGPYSGPGSPVESLDDSTETESDEEDYLTGLTQQMVHFALQDDACNADRSLNCYNKFKAKGASGSPQSTLCNDVVGCSCRWGSGFVSPNCHLKSSPKSSLATESSWDLLRAASREVAKMRTFEGGGGYARQSRNERVGPTSSLRENLIPNSSRLYNQSVLYQQLLAAQLQQLRQQQMMKQQGSAQWGHSRRRGNNFQQQQQNHSMVMNRAGICKDGIVLGSSVSTWSTSHQSKYQSNRHGSGMRAVFLGSLGNVKRECSGTGVFLPRTGTPTETRKKSGCSTVLLPDRVVQALNLNLESVDGPLPQFQPR